MRYYLHKMVTQMSAKIFLSLGIQQGFKCYLEPLISCLIVVQNKHFPSCHTEQLHLLQRLFLKSLSSHPKWLIQYFPSKYSSFSNGNYGAIWFNNEFFKSYQKQLNSEHKS